MDALRRPGQRAGLTREHVLAAARELLAQRGVDALTMRALAERLDVRPNALYSHVASKTALIDELLDDALGAVDAPPPDAPDPIAAMHALMSSTYRVLLTHADLIPLYLTRQGARGPNAQHLGELMRALLDRGGVTGKHAGEALHVLIVYTIGSAAFATRGPLATADTTPTAAEDYTAHFDHGLHWLITGIVSQRTTPPHRPLPR